MSLKTEVKWVDASDLLTVSASPRFQVGSCYKDTTGNIYRYVIYNKGAGSVALATGYPVGWYKTTTDWTVTPDVSDCGGTATAGTPLFAGVTLAYTTAVDSNGAVSTVSTAGTLTAGTAGSTAYTSYYMWIQVGGNCTCRFQATDGVTPGGLAAWTGDGYLEATGLTAGSTANFVASNMETVASGAGVGTAGKETKLISNQ